jgi:hypothetical protein
MSEELTGKRFFFEKKKQKTFVNLVPSRLHPRGPESQKFLGRLFSKRRILDCLAP